ncbi:MAG: type II secretion system protein [Verrucomicrobiales bacterium]|nr:hypothetical protein [Verrucomicrobiota bacterium JB025]
MSLLELTVVILVLLSLITIVYVGARAWKRGSDRSMCILHIRQVQQGVRGYSHMNSFDPGDTVAGLKDEIIGAGRFVESTPNCPGGGSYQFDGGEDLIPEIGDLYMSCTLGAEGAPEDHNPQNTADW